MEISQSTGFNVHMNIKAIFLQLFRNASRLYPILFSFGKGKSNSDIKTVGS